MLRRVRRDHRRPGRGRRVLLPQARRRDPAVRVRRRCPGELGFDSQPSWWPIPLLALSGLLVARDDPLPARAPRGTSRPRGSRPAVRCGRSSFPASSSPAFATLSLGVVLGPEAPLIAIGSGMGVLAVHLIKRDAPEMASVVIGAAGSFAAIATLLGSPLAGRVPAHGGRRARRGADGRRARAGAARGRHRVADLHRPRRLDRVRHVLARGAGHPAGRQPDRRRVPLGDRDRRPGGARSARSSGGWRSRCSRSSQRAQPRPDAARRRRDRHPRPRSSSRRPTSRSPTCSSPARTSSRR